MRVVNHFSLNRAAYEIRRLRIMHSEVRRNFILIKVRVAVPAAVRAGVVGPDVISEKAAALLLVLLSFLIRYRCRTPRPFLHSPFRFRDCKLYVPDVLKGMVRHAAADIDPVLPQILILIAADKADAVPPRDLRKCLSNLSLFPRSHFSAFGEVPHGLRVEVEEGDHAGLNLPCERLCHPGEALNMPADRVPVIYYDRGNPPGHGLRTERRGELSDVSRSLFPVRDMRLKLPAVRVHRDKPERAELSDFIKVRNERSRVFRPEAEDVHYLGIEPVACHLQGVVGISGEHIPCTDPVDEPF